MAQKSYALNSTTEANPELHWRKKLTSPWPTVSINVFRTTVMSFSLRTHLKFPFRDSHTTNTPSRCLSKTSTLKKCARRKNKLNIAAEKNMRMINSNSDSWYILNFLSQLLATRLCFWWHYWSSKILLTYKSSKIRDQTTCCLTLKMVPKQLSRVTSHVVVTFRKLLEMYNGPNQLFINRAQN